MRILKPLKYIYTLSVRNNFVQHTLYEVIREGRINDFDKKIIRLEEQYQAFVNFRKEKEIDDIRNSVNNNQEILNKFEANAFQIRLNIPQEFINNSNS